MADVSYSVARRLAPAVSSPSANPPGDAKPFRIAGVLPPRTRLVGFANQLTWGIDNICIGAFSDTQPRSVRCYETSSGRERWFLPGASPQFEPGQRRLAFIGPSRISDVFVVRDDGTIEAHSATNATSVGWASDGVVVLSSGRLMSLDGARQFSLGAGQYGAAAWAASGRYVTLLEAPTTEAHFRLIDLESERDVQDLGRGLKAPVWSSHSAALAWTDGDDSWLWRASIGATKLDVPTGSLPVVVDPTGQCVLLFDASGNGQWIQWSTSHGRERVTLPPGFDAQTVKSWSPDGSYLAVTSETPSILELWTTTLA